MPYHNAYQLYRFDMMVNGGASVDFQFQRNPFVHKTQLVAVPPNEIVVIPEIFMITANSSETRGSFINCHFGFSFFTFSFTIRFNFWLEKNQKFDSILTFCNTTASKNLHFSSENAVKSLKWTRLMTKCSLC